jgi:hypothetical protein
MYYETQELACAILGINCDDLVDEGRENEIDEALYVKFGIDMDQFVNIVEALLPFTPIVQAGLTGNKYHAFVNEKESLMIVKQLVEEEKQ